MKRVLTAAVLIPIVLLVLLKGPPLVFVSVTGLVAILATREYLDVTRGFGVHVESRLVLGIEFLLFAIQAMLESYYATTWGPRSGISLLDLYVWSWGFLAILIVAPLLIVTVSMRAPELRSGAIGGILTSFSLPYIALPMLSFGFVRQFREGKWLILFMFIIVWSGDTLAYYIGRAIGTHLLAPRVSPKKTWEGSIASAIGSVLIGGILFPVLFGVGLSYPSDDSWSRLFRAAAVGIALALVINVAAQFGDLVESLFKRGAGIKDSGTILPGHGGVLDRIDALLFAAPVVFLYTIMNYWLHLDIPYPRFGF